MINSAWFFSSIYFGNNVIYFIVYQYIVYLFQFGNLA